MINLAKDEYVKVLSAFIDELDDADIADAIEFPPDQKLGDLAFPCFSLAKTRKKSPAQIAEEIAKECTTSDSSIFEEIKHVGPYVNAIISNSFLAQLVSEHCKKNVQVLMSKEQSDTIVVEYPAPNTNKPLHLGHVRNMCLGSSVSLILGARGNKVHQVNLLNDRGVHICKSMLAYQKFAGGKDPDKKSDHFVGDMYVLYSQKVEEHPELDEEIKVMLRKWEDGDKEVRDLWTKMNKWATDGYDQTFQAFNISFEKVYKESDIYKEGSIVVQDALENGVFEKDDKNNIVAMLEDKGLPNKIMLRADGTSIYMTQDIALAKHKQKDFSPNQSIYVVGSEQNLHFQQLFAILDMLGFKEAKGCHHLSYGMIYLPSGRMKSREGKVVDADELIAEMSSIAEKEIIKRHDTIDPKLAKERARKIGMSAIRFFILKFEPTKDFVYDPEESISFEGETGPYIQYTYARIQSINRKAKEKNIAPGNIDKIGSEEHHLLSLLTKFPLVVDEAAKNLKPSLICRHLLDLAQAFNEYYHKNIVLSEDIELSSARLQVLLHCATFIEAGMALLGIEMVDEM